MRINWNIARAVVCACAAGLIGSAAAEDSAKDEAAKEYADKIRPLIDGHCYDCHGPERQKADLNLSIFENFDEVRNTPEIWQTVLERVQAFEMPPDKGPELSFGERRKLLKWLRGLPKPKKPDCNQLASDRTQNFYRGYVMSRRLNRAEYDNTVRDLFGLDLDLEALLPADAGGGEGFDNTGSALFISSIHIEKYLEAAERATRALFPESMDALRPGTREARKQLLAPFRREILSEKEGARRILENTARRAFRRPVTGAEVDRFMALYDRVRGRGESFGPAIRLALQGILMSPHFLFLAEPEPEEGGVQPLPAVPLASKLSYFLWASMPDEELLSLAESGELLDENVYREQIYRMLADPKARALGDRFATQWLDLQRLGTEVRPDPTKFPEFDDLLMASMKEEVTAYFNHIIQNDRSLLELIDSDYSFINGKLAEIYSLAGAPGPEHRKVRFDNRNRGGIIAMPAIHALTSYPYRTSPVLRGKWVLETILGAKVNPPPPDVPELEEDGEEASAATLREQLEIHRTKAECAACHDKMDPLGFGMENFDVLGRWREKENGHEIDASGTLPNGKTFEGPAGLKSVLMDRKDDVMEHLAKKMTGFAFGRELNKHDQCVIDDSMKALRENGYRAKALIETIATSFPFRHRFYPNQD